MSDLDTRIAEAKGQLMWLRQWAKSLTYERENLEGVADSYEGLLAALQQTREALREAHEFVEAHTLLEQGVVNFDLQAEEVERFRRASEQPTVTEVIRAALAPEQTEGAA